MRFSVRAGPFFLLVLLLGSAIFANYLRKNLFTGHNEDASDFGKSGRSPLKTQEMVTVVPGECDSLSRGKFDKIYEQGKWSVKLLQPSDFYGYAYWPPKESRKKSASGRGSELGKYTTASLQIVIDTIKNYGATSMIDIPCGDVNWILDSFETDSLPVYLGMDVTLAVIEVNQQRFAHHRNKKILFWDATECPLPKFRFGSNTASHAFDIVHVRDVIQHLTLGQGVRFFCNVFTSGARVLIATTFPEGKNIDIEEGSYYQNDLTKEPFLFPKSDDCVATHPEAEEDITCVYNLTAAGWMQSFVERKC